MNRHTNNHLFQTISEARLLHFEGGPKEVQAPEQSKEKPDAAGKMEELKQERTKLLDKCKDEQGNQTTPDVMAKKCQAIRQKWETWKEQLCTHYRGENNVPAKDKLRYETRIADAHLGEKLWLDIGAKLANIDAKMKVLSAEQPKKPEEKPKEKKMPEKNPEAPKAAAPDKQQPYTYIAYDGKNDVARSKESNSWSKMSREQLQNVEAGILSKFNTIENDILRLALPIKLQRLTEPDSHKSTADKKAGTDLQCYEAKKSHRAFDADWVKLNDCAIISQKLDSDLLRVRDMIRDRGAEEMLPDAKKKFSNIFRLINKPSTTPDRPGPLQYLLTQGGSRDPESAWENLLKSVIKKSDFKEENMRSVLADEMDTRIMARYKSYLGEQQSQNLKPYGVAALLVEAREHIRQEKIKNEPKKYTTYSRNIPISDKELADYFFADETFQIYNKDLIELRTKLRSRD